MKELGDVTYSFDRYAFLTEFKNSTTKIWFWPRFYQFAFTYKKANLSAMFSTNEQITDCTKRYFFIYSRFFRTLIRTPE